MSKRKCRADIPVQLADMGPEFAGFQYQAALNDCCNGSKLSKKYFIFKDILLKLIYSNYIWYNITNEEAQAIEYALINEGRTIACRTTFNLETETPEGIFYGRYCSHPTIDAVNFYGNPIAAGVVGYNGRSYYTTGEDNFVVGFATSAYQRIYCLTYPIITYVDRLAREMDDAYSAWKVACETRKCGMVFQVPTARTANFLKKVLQEVGENNPYIVLTGELQGEAQVVLNSGSTNQITEFHDNFVNTISFCMDMLGIENSPNNKKERLVVTEAEMSRGLSRYIGADGLKARRTFADECNRKFGTNIQVENYLASVIDELMDNATELGIQSKDGDTDEPTE